jgi:hypothetical protein
MDAQHEPEDDAAPEWFTVQLGGPRKIVVLDSATFVGRYLDAEGTDLDNTVIVSASYSGVYCAKLVQRASPIGAIGIDCGIGKDGAGVAGLWYYEALGIPAAAADIATVELGNGADLWENGKISRSNWPAHALGVVTGMSVKDAAHLVATAPSPLPEPDGENREVMVEGRNGHNIVATNSIAECLAEDFDTNVMCTSGHTGRSVIGYITGFRPYAFICSDGGIGKNNSGLLALGPANDAGIPGASVSADTARMGDGHSTYEDGVISATNDLAAAAGVRIGMTAREAARLLMERDAR